MFESAATDWIQQGFWQKATSLRESPTVRLGLVSTALAAGTAGLAGVTANR